MGVKIYAGRIFIESINVINEKCPLLIPSILILYPANTLTKRKGVK